MKHLINYCLYLFYGVEQEVIFQDVMKTLADYFDPKAEKEKLMNI